MASDELPLEVRLDHALRQAGIESLMASRKERLPGHPQGSPEAIVVRLRDKAALDLIKLLEETTTVADDAPWA
jgi:hypothetical protein